MASSGNCLSSVTFKRKTSPHVITLIPGCTAVAVIAFLIASITSPPHTVQAAEVGLDECRAQCEKEYPNSFEEYFKKQCVKDCFKRDTSLAESSLTGCMERCDGSYSDHHQLQQRHDCYSECSAKYKNTAEMATERALQTLPATRGADAYDRCIMDRCYRIQVGGPGIRKLFNECCRSCEAEFRPKQAKQRAQDQARQNRSHNCEVLVQRLIQASVHGSSGWSGGQTISRGILDELEMSGLSPAMTAAINDYFRTGSNVQLFRIQELCQQGG